MNFTAVQPAETEAEALAWELEAWRYISPLLRANTLAPSTWLAYGQAVNVVTRHTGMANLMLSQQAGAEAERHTAKQIVDRDGCCGGGRMPNGTCTTLGGVCPRFKEAEGAALFANRLLTWLEGADTATAELVESE